MPKSALNPRGFDEFVSKILQNENKKLEMIRTVSKTGIRRLLEESFDLTPRQREELGLLEPRDLDDFASRAFVLGLVHDARITLTHEGHSEPNLWIVVRITSKGLEVGAGC